MDMSTSRFAAAAAGVQEFAGAPVADLPRAGLLDMHRALARALVEAKRLYAPVAAEIARRSTPTSDGLARSEGFGSAEMLVASAIGGTMAEARMLIAAGQTLEETSQAGPVLPPHGAPDAALDSADATAGAGAEPGTAGPGAGEPGAGEPGAGEPGAAVPMSSTASSPVPLSPVPLSPTGQALRDGAISTEAAALIRETLRALDGETRDVEMRLVGKAHEAPLFELRRACERERAHHDAARAEARQRRQREARSLYMTETADGMVRLAGLLDPDTALPLKAFIDMRVGDEFRRRRELDVHDDRTAAQIRADVLAGLAEHGLGCEHVTTGVRTTLAVHVDLDDLRRGAGLAECDTTGTQVGVGTVRRLCAEAQVIPVVMGGRSLPLDLGRAERLCSKEQKLALAARDRGCAFCAAPAAWCDAHHIRHFADGGATDLLNCVLLCRRCHTMIHQTAWEVELRGDDVWFIPPTEVDARRRPRPAARHRVSRQSGTAPEPPPPDGEDPGGALW